MRKITLEDIDFEVDYREILTLESALRHEVKAYGKQEFISKYTKLIKEGCYSDDTHRENIVIALIDEMCELAEVEKTTFEEPKLDKFVLGCLEFYLIGNSTSKDELIRKAYNKAHNCFKERGFLFEREDEKYNGTFD